jgi:hypothetical protein
MGAVTAAAAVAANADGGANYLVCRGEVTSTCVTRRVMKT